MKNLEKSVSTKVWRFFIHNLMFKKTEKNLNVKYVAGFVEGLDRSITKMLHTVFHYGGILEMIAQKIFVNFWIENNLYASRVTCDGGSNYKICIWIVQLILNANFEIIRS